MPLPRAAEKADEQLLLVRDAIEEEEPGRRDVRGKAVQRTAQDSAPARTTSMRRLCAGGRAATDTICVPRSRQPNDANLAVP